MFGVFYLWMIQIQPMSGLYARNKTLIYYALAMAALLILLRWLEIRFLIMSHGFEVYAGIMALIFTGLGIWLALKLGKPKTVIVEKPVVVSEFVFNETECQALGISKRELEVLALMAKGKSNNEIAAELFVSLNTIKTHGARLFEKLDVNRRTQAVEKARNLRLIP